MTFQGHPENLGRLKSKLRRNPSAMAALFALGLDAVTIDALHLGLKEPYSPEGGEEIRDALCFPLLDEAMRSIGRYAYMNLDGVTKNPSVLGTWGPGRSSPYWLGSQPDGSTAVVSEDVVECWLAWQALQGDNLGFHLIAPSHSGDWPSEWRSPLYWARFARVIVLPGSGSTRLLQTIAERASGCVHRLTLPLGAQSIRTLQRNGPSLKDLLAEAEPWYPDVPVQVSAVPPDMLGMFEAQAVSLTGAFVNGKSYYPFSVESRLLESSFGGMSRMVQAYETLVLRSDGHLLGSETLAAPRGTPSERRILALTDGTRIQEAPRTTGTSSWSFGSIQTYVDWRLKGGDKPFRAFERMFADVEAYIRERIWLPVDDHYALAASYVLISHVQQVFDAIPILLVTGEHATGKSELGDAIARLAANATVAGQLRAAGMIRLLDETRGLIVLDDMDGTGAHSVLGTGELAQAIKTGYKRSTSRKPIADRGGRIRMVDFFGCKVLTNTRGVDAVLGSRSLTIRTETRPVSANSTARWWLEADLDGLRDELHCWGMADAGALHAAYRRLPPPRNRAEEIGMPILALSGLASGSTADRLAALLES